MAADMSYLKEKPIAILGCGAVGKTMAGDCALAGAKVRIWEQEAFQHNFNNRCGQESSFPATSSAIMASRDGAWDMWTWLPRIWQRP